MDKAYLEDLAPGQVFTSQARAVVGADAIKRFAGEFDPQPWHLNETVARSTFFKEMIASGWHTTALTMQLIVQTLPLSEGIIGSGVDELRWPRPEAHFEVELTVNHGRTKPYEHGDGYGHLAVAVDDLAAEHARLANEGFVPNPIKEMVREGALMARFFFVQDPDGYKIEVLQKHGRYC